MAYVTREREEGVGRGTICPAVLDTHRSHRGFACCHSGQMSYLSRTKGARLSSGLADESPAACLLLLIGALSFCCCPSPSIATPLRVVHVLSKPRNGIHRSSERAKKKTESTCIDKLKAAQMFAIALTCLTTMEWYHVRGRVRGAARQGGSGPRMWMWT